MTLFNFNLDLGQWRFPFRRQKTVLVIEDDSMTIELIRLAATPCGFAIETARTGEEGLGILHGNGKKFVAALIDVHLPGMTGWQFRRHVRDQWPTLLVIVMSAAPESFRNLPTGEALHVLVKGSNYGELFRSL